MQQNCFIVLMGLLSVFGKYMNLIFIVSPQRLKVKLGQKKTTKKSVAVVSPAISGDILFQAKAVD